MGVGGGGGHIAPAADFFVGASVFLRKPSTKSKKPVVKRVKLEIVNYKIFINTSKFELQIQFRPTTKLYIRKMLWSDIFQTRKFGQSKNYKP